MHDILKLCEIDGAVAAKIMTITPHMARTLQDRPANNRRIYPTEVAKHAAAMLSGAWKYNGIPILISESGTVLDGQHRLQACIESGVAFTTLVVYDLPDEVSETVDTGRNRNLADLLHMDGLHIHEKRIAAALPYVYFWDYADGSRVKTSSGDSSSAAFNRGGGGGIKDMKLDRDTLHHWFRMTDNRDKWIESAKVGDRGQKLAQPAVLCSTHYIMSRTSEAKAALFMDQLITGLGLIEESDPVNKLRSWLLKANLSKERGLVVNPREKFFWVMKAWSHKLQGKSLRVFNYPRYEYMGNLKEDIEKFS